MKLASALLFVLLLCSGAVRATAFSTDQSDLWWVPAESGWGIQFTQRGQMIFATMYVHRPDGSAVWYTGLMNPTLLPATWSGDLYVTDGPWFGTSSYNPASVVNRKVGTISWYAQSGDSGSLTYSVDGVSVSKTIQRFSLTLDDFTGSFLGGYSRTSSGCLTPAGCRFARWVPTAASASTTCVSTRGKSVHTVAR